MSDRTRIKYTSAQKQEIWDRWKKGESLNSIGRLFDRPSSSIFNILAPTGGIRLKEANPGLPYKVSQFLKACPMVGDVFLPILNRKKWGERRDSNRHGVYPTGFLPLRGMILRERVIVKCGVWEHDYAAFL